LNDQTRRKLSVRDFQAFKARGEAIAMVTAYDYPVAALADEAGVDSILVGDSIGNNMLGYDTTLPVSMDEMAVHCRAVSRAVTRAFVVGDMPYMSYQASTRDAILNAGRLMAEGAVDAVKLEGGAAMAPTVAALTAAGVPVMGHVGLTPQSAAALGGFRVQAREASSAARLVDDALALQDAGVFAVVLEATPDAVAELVTARLSVPTIGIGAGVGCDGQVLVLHDMFGLSKRRPKFAKQYADLAEAFRSGFASYRSEVKARQFPDDAHSYSMEPEEASRFQELMAGIRA
jgi:3-methyl-2-oxobutanoate hydroxymethyltransferase